MVLLCGLSNLPGRGACSLGSHSSRAEDRVGDSAHLPPGAWVLLGCSLGSQGGPNKVLLPLPSCLIVWSLPHSLSTPLFSEIPCIAPPTPPARNPPSQWLCQSHSWAPVPSSSSPYGVTFQGQCAVQRPVHPRQRVKGASPPCSLLDPSQHHAGPKRFKQEWKPLS